MGKSRVKKSVLPEDMTVEQASEFWDKHSIFEFEGVEKVDVRFKLKKKYYVGISRDIFKKVNAYAKKHKADPEALIESWISEKTSELGIRQ